MLSSFCSNGIQSLGISSFSSSPFVVVDNFRRPTAEVTFVWYPFFVLLYIDEDDGEYTCDHCLCIFSIGIVHGPSL